MIRKFSITNAITISPEEQASLAALAASAKQRQRLIGSSEASSERTESLPESREQYLQSTESPGQSTDNRFVDGNEGTISDEGTGDEGLSMSEEEDQPSNRKDINNTLEDLDVDQKLISAAQRGQSQLVKDLISEGARIIIDQNGTTAAHQAAHNGFADVVRILLECGCDADIPDSGGYTALHKAAGKGHLDVLELLINEGCDIDIQNDTFGNTPLHEAAWNGFSKSVDLLIKSKSNPFIANRAGCTPLHLAAQSGHNQSARTLLYAGCSPDVKNNYGDAPLHTAARYGHAGIARILISAGCSISEQNKNGDTALHIAAAFKRRKIAKLLVDGGINISLRNKQDETASDIARRKDHGSVVEIIHMGQMEPTGGVRLTYHSPNVSDQSHSNRHSHSSRETTPNSKEPKEHVHSKKQGGLVTWIKKKFSKDKGNQHKDGLLYAGMPKPHDPYSYRENMGLFSQYVKRQGFAYYRDLAGNIRQGPVGYVPNSHCEFHNNALDSQLHRLPPHAPQHNHHNHRIDPRYLDQRLHDLELRTSQQIYDIEMATQAQIRADKQECIDRLEKHKMQESSNMSKHMSQVETNVKTGLQTWLYSQMADQVDPFAYDFGAKQQRFGDDFDHQRIARYDAMVSNPCLPPPRLFRSRSDETLSHSEYSYHGRAYKSKEAAMEELKTLKHHEEMRERRKRMRAGIPLHLNTSREILTQTEPDSNQTANKYQASQQVITKRDLWMSRDNLINDETSDTAGNSTTTETPRYLTETIKPNPKHNDRSINAAKSAATNSLKDPQPLKSAMRQTVKPVRLFRSNSLPRSSTAEFTPLVMEEKKQKTVRYDETVKATEISKDSPPSHTNQSEETLLPVAEREAPIGGHDEKYSEYPSSKSTPVISPSLSYQSISTSLNKKSSYEAATKDIRDSIVMARNELQARGKTMNDDIKYNNMPIPVRNNLPPPCRPASNVLNGDLRKSTEKLNNHHQHQVPFHKYIPQHFTKQPQASTPNQSNYDSLPRQHKKPPDYATVTVSSTRETQLPNPPATGRAALPTYEEIQTQRRQASSGPVYQQIPYKPSTYNRSVSQPPLPVRSISNISNPVTDQRQFSQINAPFPLPQNTNINTNRDVRSGINTGSCSSSNPDSGYSGQTAESYSSRPSSFDNRYWHHPQQQAPPLPPQNRQLPAVPHQQHSTSMQSGRSRVVIPNMITDV